MTYELTATISHKEWGDPVIKKMQFSGDTFEEILSHIKNENVPQQHLFNLKMFRRTAFKDARGVKHSWKLKEVKE